MIMIVVGRRYKKNSEPPTEHNHYYIPTQCILITVSFRRNISSICILMYLLQVITQPVCGCVHVRYIFIIEYYSVEKDDVLLIQYCKDMIHTTYMYIPVHTMCSMIQY